MADNDVPLFQLEFRPSPPPPPPTVIIRRKNSEVPLVMPEDYAFELYLLLKAHFEEK
jgi:hypothetical protein